MHSRFSSSSRKYSPLTNKTIESNKSSIYILSIKQSDDDDDDDDDDDAVLLSDDTS